MKQPPCSREGCTRHVYFTDDQLCRPHGLAVRAEIDAHDDALFEGAPTLPDTPPAPKPPRAARKPVVIPPGSPTTESNLSEGETE